MFLNPLNDFTFISIYFVLIWLFFRMRWQRIATDNGVKQKRKQKHNKTNCVWKTLASVPNADDDDTGRKKNKQIKTYNTSKTTDKKHIEKTQQIRLHYACCLCRWEFAQQDAANNNKRNEAILLLIASRSPLLSLFRIYSGMWLLSTLCGD